MSRNRAVQEGKEKRSEGKERERERREVVVMVVAAAVARSVPSTRLGSNEE